MLIRLDTLRERLHGVVLNKGEQGHNIEGLQDELDKLPDSYDEFVNFTKKLTNLKFRSDWPYVEPSSINELSLSDQKISSVNNEDKTIQGPFNLGMIIVGSGV